MKSGVSLQQMLTEVKRQSESKEDYLIAPNRLRMESYGKEMFLHLSDDNGTELIEPMTITGIAHRQIGTHLRIPAAYYDRMLEERPDLLAYNANTWFKQENSQRMLRTLDGSARAYLSNRYRRIDNIDIAGVTLPILGGLPDIRFESCQITESRMYIKAVNPRLQAEVSPGDIVQAGVIISNSEVGLGSVNIQPLIYRLVCSNGMVVNEASARRNHVGRVTDSEENFSVYSQATLDAEDKAFVMKIQDTVRAAVEEARFAQVVGKMQEAKAAQMDTHDVPAVVKLASKEFHITDSESTGVLQRLIESNDLTLYGLSNAVTRHSQDVESYDRASELESIGYSILTMVCCQIVTIGKLGVEVVVVISFPRRELVVIRTPYSLQRHRGVARLGTRCQKVIGAVPKLFECFIRQLQAAFAPVLLPPVFMLLQQFLCTHIFRCT